MIEKLELVNSFTPQNIDETNVMFQNIPKLLVKTQKLHHSSGRHFEKN